MSPFRKLMTAMVSAAAFGATASSGFAEESYPSKPIKIVVPFTAGSATDIIARAVGEGMRKELGQPIIVENKPGAGGTLGAAQVAAAPADGYILLVHSAGHVANAYLYPSLRYDPVKDFKPLAMLASVPNVMVVNPQSGLKDAKAVVQKAKAEPGKLLYASAGNGSATHMNAEKFRVATGIDAVHVPYRGTPEAMTDVIAGQVQWFFAPITSALPMIKDRKMVALAVGSPHRAAALPDIPTTVEAGFPGSDYDFWIGLFAPSKLPAPVAERIRKATDAALKSEAMKTRLLALGADYPSVEPARFEAFVRNESAEVGKLVTSAKITQN
ncbi:Bug family tripartite tricarboxylate transporter substrate binding protein [Comamonas guangdongensis]|uniref:Bug family tripartite tricarboxylate transporter substrate binding protein n=1 Tax=Comamonas guangdongensis TaxID=510515 RepID=A0ABV3ZVP4_9BURK